LRRVEPWDRGHDQENEYENSGVVRRADASFTPGVKILFVLSRTWERKWYGARRKAAEVANDIFVRTLGLPWELEPTTKNILTGFAWREREPKLGHGTR
jgi:hypothetical protein